MKTSEIENILRQAPQPKPPGNLQQRLKAQALNARSEAAPMFIERKPVGGWLRRWWPALAPTAISLACAATLTSQQNQLHRLRADLENRAVPTPGAPRISASNTSGQTSSAPAAAEEELQRLRTMVASLTAEISKLEHMRTENGRLRAELASRAAGAFTPEELTAMEDARDRAMSIQCVNNLKQLGLAVRIWSIDHQQLSPPNVLSLTNELGGSFKTLVCPADAARQPATDAGSLTLANCSYEYLAPMAPETEPQRIVFRCPIHGNIGLIDGSVQMRVAKEHPNWIVQRDGKLFMEVPRSESGPDTPGIVDRPAELPRVPLGQKPPVEGDSSPVQNPQDQ